MSDRIFFKYPTSTLQVEKALTDPTFVDLNGDGKEEAFIGATDGTLTYFTYNRTTEKWVQDNTNNPLKDLKVVVPDFSPNNPGQIIGGISHPDFVDIDRDGDFDLFVGTFEGHLFFYENTGTKTNPIFPDQTKNTITDLTLRSTKNNNLFDIQRNQIIGRTLAFADPSFVDLNGDSKQDLFLGQYQSLVYYQNISVDANNNGILELNELQFSRKDGNDNPLNIASSSDPLNILYPSFYPWSRPDVNDAFVGQRDGQIFYYKNIGTATNPLFERVDSENPFRDFNRLPAVPGGRGQNTKVAFVDLEGDGILEAYAGSQFDFGDPRTRGDIKFFKQEPPPPPPPPPPPLFGDVITYNSLINALIVGDSKSGPNLEFKISGPGSSQFTEVRFVRVDLNNQIVGTENLFSLMPNRLSPSGFTSIDRTVALGPYQPGDRFRIEIQRQDGRVLGFNSQQARITDLGGGQFNVGFEEGNDLSFNDLVFNIKQTTNPLPTGATSEQRSDREIIDLRGLGNGPVQATFTFYREAKFKNFVGLYKIDDLNGTVNGVAPGQAGYAEIAVNNGAGFSLSVDNGGISQVTTVLAGGSLYAPFMIANDTPENFLDLNSQNAGGRNQAFFAFLGANPDGVDHLRLLGNNTFGFEDKSGGGDFDYNDFVFQVNLS